MQELKNKLLNEAPVGAIVKTEDNLPNFQLVENVKIVISVELGKRTISFPDLMKLEAGSVLELRRATGENVDIYAGKVLIGTGEILVVDSNLAIRISDLFFRNGFKKEEETEKKRNLASFGLG